ncbi:PREDICTED: SH3 domain-binding glutamic acid-rich-like protein 3 [Amphimedon queenslandica]|uniref:SH3 domain-binding glutamic acid-rich-like protein n=1 Tax=Amphimedon queenslandica TaxID=400682 RepID=A0A1X7VJ16_AMPQE|nr:PREDICTED: SH3 domain-binding glutamic acid-rich-like protein 3 [Amphimedon queenslandica]|eukprot:XP_003384043.1 PREDICTED: SH3 domain-binding glutamic acid-rich-like protein 3 [Amphimedon queenslandica]
MAAVNYYYSSVSSNLELKKNQQKIEMILDSKKIPYNKLDVAADTDLRDKMRGIIGDPKALPPQLFNGDTYCGDFDAFEEALETETLEEFLKLK